MRFLSRSNESHVSVYLWAGLLVRTGGYVCVVLPGLALRCGLGCAGFLGWVWSVRSYSRIKMTFEEEGAGRLFGLVVGCADVVG